MKEIELPLSLKYVGWNCFHGCKQLTSLKIPSQWIIKRDRIFIENERLYSFEIPTQIQTVNNVQVKKSLPFSFNHILSDRIIELSDNCFYSWYSLRSITLPSSITMLGDYCFYDCTSLSSISLPSSVKRIGHHCFSNCYCLFKVTLPESISYIPDNCFEDCKMLRKLVLKNENVTFGDDCFKGCDYFNQF